MADLQNGEFSNKARMFVTGAIIAGANQLIL
jgi:hypothetical protein